MGVELKQRVCCQDVRRAAACLERRFTYPMNIRTPFSIPKVIAGIVAIAALLFADFVGATVTIGEAVLQSKPGEPLLARVELMTEDRERIDGACLSLLTPDPLKDDIGNYLGAASLAIKNQGLRQYVEISSPKPFAEVPLRMRLQVKCPDSEGTVKELTISRAGKVAGAHDQSTASQVLLVGEQKYEPQTEKMSEEEVVSLRTRQIQLEADLLSMHQQLRLLQEDSNAIKLRLGQLSSSAATLSSVVSSVAEASAPASEQENRSRPAVAVVPMEAQAEKAFPPDMLIAASGLGMALILWLGLRAYAKSKSRTAPRLPERATEAAADSTAAHKAPAPLIIKHPPQIKSGPVLTETAPLKASAVKAVAAAAPSAPPQKPDGEVTEVDSLLEEASLYAASGRQVRAVEILQEIIKRYPSKAEAWTLLLSLYSSLGKAAAFESTAREFLMHHKSSPSWIGVQALGRTLDHGNPLYAEHGIHPAPKESVPHQPIGDVLIEMGILSKRELLGYLDGFDPKKHGRFGGYLVARKAISISQLDQALLQQQGLNSEEKPIKLPSLQEIEQFLADFDPKRHGSVSEYMALHDAATPEQFDQVLREQSTSEAAERVARGQGTLTKGTES